MKAELTAKEEKAMQVIWKVGEGTIKTFLENMDPFPRYTTLASTIKNLEKKGYVTSRLIGNTYLYKPAVAHGQHLKKSLTNLVRQHFNNSYKEVVAFFADQHKISPEELRDIIHIIEHKNK